MSSELYDVIIIGSGPAGIQAAIHAARKKTRVLMVGRIENSALFNAHIENYAFVPGVSQGSDLLRAGLGQVKQFGAEIRNEDILQIDQHENTGFSIHLEDGTDVQARTIIFAIGVAKKKLGVPGEKELLGRGVSYCVDCDANFYRNATVAVIGNHSAAADGALTLLDYADTVYLITRDRNISPSLEQRLQSSGVNLLSPAWVKEIRGDNAVSSLLLDNGETLPVDGIFIELGSKGALELATQIGIALDSEHFKYIAVDRQMRTNISGVFAAGDITGPPYQMAKAVGEGCVAGMQAATCARRMKADR